ncbi:MAG: hypothetical protein GY865_06645 [candidate division Zixibacteria bacterium]|nr:hypothetical protein [candidate division Zixibacteria bacterium]
MYRYLILCLLLAYKVVNAQVISINNIESMSFKIVSNNKVIYNQTGFIWFQQVCDNKTFLWHSYEDEGELNILIVNDEKINKLEIGPYSYKPINSKLGIKYLSEENFDKSLNSLFLINNADGSIIRKIEIENSLDNAISDIYADMDNIFFILSDVSKDIKCCYKINQSNYESELVIRVDEYLNIVKSISGNSLIIIDDNVEVKYFYSNNNALEAVYKISDTFYSYDEKLNKLIKIKLRHLTTTYQVFDK